MPTYEYLCRNGHRFEEFSPTMNDHRYRRCPSCGKRAERQISGGAGLVFKGSGFYATDYKRAPEKPPATGEKQEPEPKADKPAKGAAEATPPDPSKKKADSADT